MWKRNENNENYRRPLTAPGPKSVFSAGFHTKPKSIENLRNSKENIRKSYEIHWKQMKLQRKRMKFNRKPMKIYGERNDLVFCIAFYGLPSTGENQNENLFVRFAFPAPQIAGGLWTRKNDKKTIKPLSFLTKHPAHTQRPCTYD